MIDSVHIASAALALLLGVLVIAQPKGTRRHIVTGRLYGLAMFTLNGAALLGYFVHDRWGPFHTLALISLATLAAGMLPFLLGHRSASDVARHGYFMAWSYVGLLAAGVSQLTTKTLAQGPWISVALPSAIVVLIGGFLIHSRLPAAVVSGLRNRSVRLAAGVGVRLPAINDTRP